MSHPTSPRALVKGFKVAHKSACKSYISGEVAQFGSEEHFLANIREAWRKSRKKIAPFSIDYFCADCAKNCNGRKVV